MFGTWGVDYHSPEYIANSRRSGGWVLAEAQRRRSGGKGSHRDAEAQSRKVNLPQIPQMGADQGKGLTEVRWYKVNLPQIPQMAADQGVGFFKRRGDAKAWASEIIQISPRMTLMISCRSKAKYNSSGIEKNNILIHCHPP